MCEGLRWAGPLPFNPTLVRLRLFRADGGLLPAVVLSIPPWFDCGPAGGAARVTIMRLSIPPWFDCGLGLPPLYAALALLSIPPWFDCGLLLSLLWQVFALPAFNPTLVRLRPGDGSVEYQPRVPFNPTLVRLRRGRWDACPQSPSPPFNPTLVRLRPAPPGRRSRPSSPFQSHLGSIAACLYARHK